MARLMIGTDDGQTAPPAGPRGARPVGTRIYVGERHAVPVGGSRVPLCDPARELAVHWPHHAWPGSDLLDTSWVCRTCLLLAGPGA